MKTNEPLYFYHVINKDADLDKGILSLQYMYDNKLYDLFDKSAEKYIYRIVDSWNIEKFKGRKEASLSREEILEALNIFRGKQGSNYIYFFRYPLYRELGKSIEELLKVKDIYKININDEQVQKEIAEIFYGFEGSNSDNKLLDREYYEIVTKEEYFKDYDDSLKIKFATLNHIGIAFKNGYCKREFLEKYEENEGEK